MANTYKVIDITEPDFPLKDGFCCNQFDSGEELQYQINKYFPSCFNFDEISYRQGNNMRESLYKCNFIFKGASSHSFYIYVFQTEGGGRPNSLEYEQRIQFRNHRNWTPDLNQSLIATNFTENEDLSNKECYAISIYKPSIDNHDVVFSAFPLGTISDKENSTTTSNSSIQCSIIGIQEAYKKGVSLYKKSDDTFIINFKPQYLIWYMKHRDDLHVTDLDKVMNLVIYKQKEINEIVLQRIYFGAPGGGKSHKVKYDVIGKDNPNSITTTFHPDSDYSSFVGSYKPFKGDDGKITYDFVPQVFAKAYVNAWKLYFNEVCKDKEYYLDIEEINRGNCAQIFGDLFQLLDRKAGFSEYPINVDGDFANYLKKELGETQGYKEIIGGDFSNILLPSNLHIVATMNTSDQSLFPMDSAFKRRWEWEYVPISFDNTEIAEAKIIIDKDHKYNWKDFVVAVNDKILSDLESSDKQLGPWFAKPKCGIIERDQFVSKVMFYLLTDAYKDMNLSDEKFYFEDLFKNDGNSKLVHFIETGLKINNIVQQKVTNQTKKENSNPEETN